MPEILRADRWVTNARMIAEAVVPLGYITGSVLDASLGEHEGFWRQWRPDSLTTNDLNAPNAEHHHDFRRLPLSWEDAFETVVLDPPYKLNGTPAMGDMDQRFGTGGAYLSREQKLSMIVDGAVSCYHASARWTLVKVMDQVEAGRMRWQTVLVTNALTELGARLVDRFDFLTTPRPQPGDRRQLTARSNYSTMLVFSKGRR